MVQSINWLSSFQLFGDEAFRNHRRHFSIFMLVSNVMHQQQLLFLAALLPLFMGVALGDIPDGFELDKAGTAILTKYSRRMP